MATELKVPSLGMDMEGANILQWFVEEGDEVEKGQLVLEIDSDKSSFEIESPADGIIRGLTGEPGETLPVGAILAFVAAPGEEILASRPDGPPADLPDEKPVPSDPTAAADGAGRPAASSSDGSRSDGGRSGVRASPVARRAAEKRGIALEDIPGSGPRGRIYLSDVLEADVREPVSPPEPAPAPAAKAAAPEAVPAGTSRREPLSRVRRIGAERTARSAAEIPHFYLTRDLAADRLVELRERLRAKMDPAPSLTELLAFVVARTLGNHPRLNARYAEGELEIFDRVNLGFAAAATDDGLVVPVLRGADVLPLRELVLATKNLVRRAREGKLKPEELSGGTFTMSNLGMMGVDAFDAIINGPETAILAVGRVRVVPEWDGEGWVPRQEISCTLSVDHRVADGADGARFLQDLQDSLSDWEMLL